MVEPVVTAKQEYSFLHFPQLLYCDDENWVPSQYDHQRELLGFRKHPFYEKGESQSWIATIDGKVVGRIAAIVNELHLQKHQDQTGFFGFFESIDDRQVADALFGKATTWLSDRGLKRVLGPMSPSIHYEAGMLRTPCDPLFTSSYNPDYYPALLEACGLKVCKTMQTFCFDKRTEVQTPEKIRVTEKIKLTVERVIQRFGIRLRPFAQDNVDRDLRTYFEFYNQTLSPMWSFTPIPPAEIEYQVKSLRNIIVPELTVVAEVDKEPVGVSLGILDYNPLLRQWNGDLFRHDRTTLQQEASQLKRARIFSSHVLPQYMMWGVGPAMLMHMMPVGLELGIEFVETSWIENENLVSRQTMERSGATPRATYHFYELEI